MAFTSVSHAHVSVEKLERDKMYKSKIGNVLRLMVFLAGAFMLTTLIQECNVNVDIRTRIDKQEIEYIITELASFKNRRYDSEYGVASMEWIAQYVSNCTRNDNVEVALFEHDKSVDENWIQPSVIARLRGKTDEVVVIGGHGDSVNHSQHIGGSRDEVAPGADDNASGTAVAMVAFCEFARQPQADKRVDLIIYSSEEQGLYGSEEIAKHYYDKKHKVKAVLQLDMVLYPNKDNSIVFITDYVDKALTTETQALAYRLGYKVVEDKCHYECSDHASWTRYGFPSVFPFEAVFHKANKRIHTSEDTLENAGGVDGAVKFAELALLFLKTNAGQE